MSQFYTEKALQQLINQGKDLNSLPANAKFSPMARDLLRKHNAKPGTATSETPASTPSGTPRIHVPVLPNYEYDWTPGADPKSAKDIEAFFYSPEIQALKQRICDIGERIWNKGYVDGNGGNITVRVGDNLVLCTPTLISKGFMSVDDICMVDLDGNQVAGTRPRTSEVNTHLGIMKHEPKAKSCVHAHPIYATAFAVAGVTPPACLIPEPEVFLGEIGFASYQTPGTPENAEEVGQLAKKHQSILMQNHGVICWGKDVEDAYWKMENTDAFCHAVTVTMQIGGPKQYGPDKLKELIEIRHKLGMPDHRLDELQECQLCDAGEYTVQTQPPASDCACELGAAPSGDVDEAVVQQITDMIMDKLNA